jgi:soluble lytic murein transglycosylase-like protein
MLKRSPKVVFKILSLIVLVVTVIATPSYAKGKTRKKASPLTPQITQEIVTRSKYYGIDEMLLLEVMRQESSFNPNACSSANARGLMQFIPSTAARFGITNPHDVSQSVDAGCRYLGFLIRKFNGRLDLVLAGYNAGEHAVEKYGNQVPPYPETQNYVRTIIQNYKRALAVKEAFLKQNNIVVAESKTNTPRSNTSYSYKTVSVVSKRPLTKKQIQQKLAELDNFSNTHKIN